MSSRVTVVRASFCSRVPQSIKEPHLLNNALPWGLRENWVGDSVDPTNAGNNNTLLALQRGRGRSTDLFLSSWHEGGLVLFPIGTTNTPNRFAYHSTHWACLSMFLDNRTTGKESIDDVYNNHNAQGPDPWGRAIRVTEKESKSMDINEPSLMDVAHSNEMDVAHLNDMINLTRKKGLTKSISSGSNEGRRIRHRSMAHFPWRTSPICSKSYWAIAIGNSDTLVFTFPDLVAVDTSWAYQNSETDLYGISSEICKLFLKLLHPVDLIVAPTQTGNIPAYSRTSA
eukprot:Gb_20950 [translate_table: standard]